MSTPVLLISSPALKTSSFVEQSSTGCSISNLAPAKPVNHAKDHFVQMSFALAHEIRNPLSNINLSVGLLEANIEDAQSREYLDAIIRNSKLINVYLSDFLHYQQSENSSTGKYQVEALLDEVLKNLNDAVHFKNIFVEKEYDSTDRQFEFCWSELRIAFTNIISNAIDSMSPGGKLRVTTQFLEKFTVVIKDSGCGISIQNLENIFQSFYTGKPGGLGIGLSTTSEILRSNRIEVKVDSQPGIGTSFTLMFPTTAPVFQL